jgi:PIN domain nuclease of toxin-antitoxin system
MLADLDTDLFLSPVVAWELSIKARSGKLPQALPLLADFGQVRLNLQGVALPIADEHALLAGSLDWPHKDPFDRMLAAQAILLGAPLLSADETFDSLPSVSRIW